jgi:hypothetical protein
MSVDIYTGVAYGFTFEGNRDEIQEEIDSLGYNFEAIQIDGSDQVLVGVSIGSASKNMGDVLTKFAPIEEGVIWALEELRSKMDVYSEIKYVFYFFYE